MSFDAMTNFYISDVLNDFRVRCLLDGGCLGTVVTMNGTYACVLLGGIVGYVMSFCVKHV